MSKWMVAAKKADFYAIAQQYHISPVMARIIRNRDVIEEAVKLAQEIGGHKAANELGIPKGTMYTWIKAFKEGRLSANEAVHTPKNALSLNDELIELRKRVKEQDKEIRRLKEENEFLEEASAFFAASRRKSAKNRD